jgi:hypothetical protein
MTKEQALMAFATAIVREILREDTLEPHSAAEFHDVRPPEPEDPNPQPKFDFDESTCEHGGLVIDRSVCPFHGPEAMGPPPTAEELDDITGEKVEEANPLIAKARRKRELREQQAKNAPLYPEDLPMSGLAGRPPEDGPPLVV